MPVCAVDLAAKFSACCYMAEDRSILGQFDSTQFPSDRAFVSGLTSRFIGTETLLVIEDTPPGLRFDINTKNVCRLQGRIIAAAEDRQLQIQWVAPMTWMRFHGYQGKAKSGTTAGWAKETCIDLGYVPPATVKGGSSKTLQDYRCAYLLALYALATA